MQDVTNIIGIFIVVFAILFGIFMLLREVMCWYWKINQVVALLTSIDNKLSNNSNISSVAVGSGYSKKCPKCGKGYTSDFTGEFCEECGTQL